MSKHFLIITTAIASLLALGTAPSQAHDAKVGKDKEKCAGIVKAGMNDCGTSTHSCAGQAGADRDPNEWIAVPKGLCERIAGGRIVQDVKKQSKN